VTRKGRKPLAAGHVAHLSGSELAKQRLAMILKTMFGQMTVAEACEKLGVCESRFHALRNQWLQEALALLEPRRVGRPPIRQVESDETRQIAELEATVEELARQVEVAGIRREIAQILPHVIKTAEPPGKKTAARPRRQRPR
jgi:transposase-like protein